ncbi:hypothetical protein [Bacillus sp. mrc49]|uniref:hypothetical protein n=1 Tax=Bacillus sp. mrc49 TaxID=2054913 RepID=UPI0018E21DB3|nr:hypothetical protein [Bacillus sp. mrc49]
MEQFDVVLKSDLNRLKHIQLSLVPNVPGEDELITHEILNHQIIETKTGVLLLIILKNPNTNEEYTYSYPDIQSVELNSSSHPDAPKYYLHCLDRWKDTQIKDAQRNKAYGLKLSDDENKLLYENNYDTYRLMLRI